MSFTIGIHYTDIWYIDIIARTDIQSHLIQHHKSRRKEMSIFPSKSRSGCTTKHAGRLTFDGTFSHRFFFLNEGEHDKLKE